jgi:phosphoribosyl-ATP pyrophosphohydrolase
MAKSTKKDRSEKAKNGKRGVPPGKKTPALKLPSARDAASVASTTTGSAAAVLDRLWSVVMSRRNASPALSHSARLLSRGTDKVAQKFGEEAIECLIEAVAGRREALIGESADVLYHLIVLWVDAGVRPEEVWNELIRREGVSGIAEKASRAKLLPLALGLNTTKIP